MPVKIKNSGPSDAQVMIIGECPGADDEVNGFPFTGTSGKELTRMLHEAGIVITECYLTVACKYRPPGGQIETFFLDKKQAQPNELVKEGVEELHAVIEAVRPRLIIALGNTTLWALRNHRAITKWRGSMLVHNFASSGSCMLMPTLEPYMVMRDWSQRAIVVHDLKRAMLGLRNGGWPTPAYDFIIRPSFEDTMDVLHTISKFADESPVPVKISSDLETRRQQIACHGIAWSPTDAICIPSMCVERPHGYWTLEQDVAIWQAEREVLTHPNIEVVGQNYLYDAQYFGRRRGYIPRLRHDTRFKQHVAWAGMQQSLDFMSSMYCLYHVYWKDEGKEWNPKIPEEQYWAYNCKDAVATFEIDTVLTGILEQLGLQQQYSWQMEVWYAALRMMFRGIKVDQVVRGKLAMELTMALMKTEQEIEYILGHAFNIRSPKQVHGLFYGQLKCKVVKSKSTKKPSCDDNALRTFAQREPLLTPVTDRISDARSLGVIYANAIKCEIDKDGRIRSSFDPTAETYRWKSSENAFGSGTNLQNWTKGNEDDEVKNENRADLPNVRKTLVPDLGYEIASIDLSGADAQTVACEANDEDLKAAFRRKEKIHAHNAKTMFPAHCKTGFEQPYYDYAKTGVHLVNYLGQAPTLAAAMKFSVYEATNFMKEWFRLHPGILEWHERIEDQLSRTRQVANKFGYRRFYFDRIDTILNEAVAWIGQSTTACVCNQALIRVEREVELVRDLDIQMLLQVHDELVFQYPIQYRHQVLSNLNPLVHVTIPYDDPWVIPWGLKVSQKSWGDCEKIDWPK